MAEYTFTVNGLPVHADYHEDDIQNIAIPLLHELTEMHRSSGRRTVAFLAGPPAMGKSTFSLFLQELARSLPGVDHVQCAGLDGFHYSNRYLESHTILRDGRPVTLRSIKGAPETFDAEHLRKLLTCEHPVFPYYDRKIHESVPDSIPITGDILIIEGNWLLLDSEPWLLLNCDKRILMIPEDPEILIHRALDRKIAGGFDPEKAAAFVEYSDRRNLQYCLEHSCRADIKIMVRTNGQMEVIK